MAEHYWRCMHCRSVNTLQHYLLSEMWQKFGECVIFSSRCLSLCVFMCVQNVNNCFMALGRVSVAVCGLTQGSPVVLHSDQCNTYFEWETTGVCATPLETRQVSIAISVTIVVVLTAASFSSYLSFSKYMFLNERSLLR